MAAQQTPSIGRIVHYVMPDGPNQGESRPAMVVRVWSDTTVNLQVFTDGTADGGAYSGGLVKAASVEFSEDVSQLGTWHWPPFVAPKEASGKEPKDEAGK